MDSILLPLLTAAVTAAATLFLLRDQRRKLAAESESLSVSAAGQVITNLQSEVKRLCERVEELETDYKQLRTDYIGLDQQLQTAKEENHRLSMENIRWRERVRVMEGEIVSLRQLLDARK